MRLRCSPLLLAGLAAMSWAPGCGGGGNGGADAGANQSIASRWQDYCTAEGRRRMTCGTTPSPASCASQGVCLANVARPELVPPLIECLLARACDDTDDLCYAQASEMGARTPRAAAAVSSCFDRLEQCQDANTDVCAGLGLTSDSFVTQIQGCLARACNEVDACLQGLLTPARVRVSAGR